MSSRQALTAADSEAVVRHFLIGLNYSKSGCALGNYFLSLIEAV